MKQRLIQGFWLCVIVGAIAYLITHPEKVANMVGAVIDFGGLAASSFITFVTGVLSHF